MAMGTGRQAEINVTPLIDVLLVLLIIFMIIIPVRSTGLEARIPQPPDERSPAPDTTPVVVRVQEDHSIQLNTQPVAWGDLAERLHTIFARRPSDVLFVGGSGNLEFAHIARVIDTAREAGIYRVALLR